MSYTNGLDKPTDYFNTVTYTGNASTLSVTGVGFQPDWVWIKNRSIVADHKEFDAVRGVTNALITNSTAAEFSQSGLDSFDSDGFTVGSHVGCNGNGNSLVAWNWLASNTTASNTDGSITSTVSANTTSGFSIVSYSGNSTSNASVGHGLGATPKIVLVKSRSNDEGWVYWQDTTGNGTADQRLDLNGTNANRNNHFMTFQSNTFTFPTLADNSWNLTGYTYIAYCFAEKKGFSKFGSYTGNGSTDGTFIYTGFRPAFFILKRTDTINSWLMYDNKRDSFNAVNLALSPNLSNAEDVSGSDDHDFLSNGIKMRNTGNALNASGSTYIYMAFAENPFVTSGGIPTTAR